MAEAVVIAQIVGGVVGAAGKAQELRFASEQEKIAARQEQIRGEADALEISKEANETLAANIARSFAAGGGVGGSSAAIIRQTLTESSFARRVALRGGEQRAATRRASAAQLRVSANLAFIAGSLGAGAVGGEAIQRGRQREPVPRRIVSSPSKAPGRRP